ncbi:DUF502 domain-containing protein [Rhodohalobacter sp. SW132]|uniref:DUF502 domain-containing protein n=1 Tax=Rhodohalobacter sp. SW132 TaxID=2293433 RepID=UPI000E278968|nr:DUF502 domain-containing protein [Rhodohalobacter sp. SW132]REL24073.1 DUF502 domain-containing protein [Rhodohalobacter sp. SW132]
MKKLLNYFLRGLLFAFPLFATFFIITMLVNWIDNTLYSILFGWLPFDIPGLGIITAFFLIAILGYLVTQAFSRSLLSYFEQMLERTPFVKIIYTAFKDLTEALVGEKKRFNRPAIVRLTDGVDRIGFITEENLEEYDIHNRVAVYFPHSYNFSGNLFLVDPSFVTPLDIDPSDALKFTVSAGVTNINSYNNNSNTVK